MNSLYCTKSLGGSCLFIKLERGTQGDETFWDVRFRRNFQDWEVTKFQRLLVLLQKQCEPVDRPDALS